MGNIFIHSSCAEDFKHFFDKHVIIENFQKGKLENIKLNDVYQRAIYAMQSKKYVIMEKLRCEGFSTFIDAYALWDALFSKKRKTHVICERNMMMCECHRNRILGMVSRLPKNMVEIKHHNKDRISFMNGSSINFKTIHSKYYRGMKIDTLFLDEAAFIDKMGENWNAIKENIEKCFVVSTRKNDCKYAPVFRNVNGQICGGENLNWFMNTYNKAQKYENEFFAV